KRRYGYYVFPVLQGCRMIGRLDAKRRDNRLVVRAFWPDPGVRMGKGRLSGLMAELTRAKAIAGVDDIEMSPGWLRT
ncbi:MAG: winged helix-turn-helix domain-containing protein, partial [Pseudomonadota bacterium]